MKILWASPNSLLDSSNGAAMMVAECMRQLAKRSCDIRILSSTSFVSPEGMSGRHSMWTSLRNQVGRFVDIKDGVLSHRTLITEQTRRRLMRSYEEQRWFDEYRRQLMGYRPDLVLFFDNSLMTLLTTNESRRNCVPVGVMLMHGNNRGQHWCRDVDWMFTDTRATADMYREREGYEVIPLGTFVDPVAVRARHRDPRHILFVNPIPVKGGILMAQLALWFAKHRPDVTIEVVDSRKTWGSLVKQVSAALGSPCETVKNVKVTENSLDMRPIYGRTRLLVVPSLWWESGPRVIVEALLNGIPVIGSNSGGIAEVLGRGGQIIEIPAEFREEPYTRFFVEPFVRELAEKVLQYFDDDSFYQEASALAHRAYLDAHDIQKNGDNLFSCLRRCSGVGSDRS